jgi:hypothetical protein
MARKANNLTAISESKHNRSAKVTVQGLVFMANPIYIHTSLSQLSRKCGILDVSHPCRLPRPVTGIALPYFLTFYYKLIQNWKSN